MSLLQYIDAEVPAFGELASYADSGSSSITQSSEAAWPDRGAVGFDCNFVAGSYAYMKTNALPQYGNGDLYIQFWVYPVSFSGNDDDYTILFWPDGASRLKIMFRKVDGELNLWTVMPGANHYEPCRTERWHCFTIHYHLTGGADTYRKVYHDGFLVYSSGNVADPGGDFTQIRVGNWYSGSALTARFYLDEIKIATSMPEPYVPPPADERPCPRRSVVLVNGNYNAFAAVFGEWIARSEVGISIPYSNICYLPNASSNETLGDYATFQAEVENDLSEFLANRPSVAENCTCFILGPGVPGYFTAGGKKISAVSRMMNYPNAFSLLTDNPLYLPTGQAGLPTGQAGAPTSVSRLTKTALRAAGVYLCTRIDEPVDCDGQSGRLLFAAKALSALSEIPDEDYLLWDGAGYPYVKSVACQKLRIKTTSGMGPVVAFYIHGNPTSPQELDSGTRAAYLEIVNGATPGGETMRASDRVYDKLYVDHFASGIGFCDEADGFDLAAFFEMLRIGGTFAEACAVAIEHVDYTALFAGLATWTIRFQLGGYNLYYGYGSPDAIDYDTPVWFGRADAQVASFSQALIPDQKYVFALRSVSSAGVEDRNTHVIESVAVNEEGNLLPLPLPTPQDVTTQVTADGAVLVGFSSDPDIGFAVPTEFDVFSDDGTGTLDLQTPATTITGVGADERDFEAVVIPSALPASFAVQARNGEQTGPISQVVTTLLDPAPAAPRLL